MGMQETIQEAVGNLVSAVSGNTEAICRDAAKSNLSDWKAAQLAKVAAIGAGGAIIPIAALIALPADLGATLNILHRAATGIAFIRLGYADDETFASILAVWSGAVTLDNALAKQVASKGLATGANVVGGQIGLKMAIKGVSMSANVLVTQKLGPKVAQKVAAKISGKLAAKATTSWIPGISAIVGGGVNMWIINEVFIASEKYCDFIQEIS